jgi:hypothetical protein
MFLCVHFVYKARNRLIGETVTGNGEGDTFDKMFRREVRCLEACRGHPCLVELHAAHHVAAGAFLVMEYTRQSLPEVMHCNTRVLGVQSPGVNIITRCAGTKSHTYDESWHRIECHIFTT